MLNGISGFFRNFAAQNYLNLKNMSKKFVIGDRTKDEWISVLDRANKKLEFTNHLASAKEFKGFDATTEELKQLQAETGYFQDLQVYVLGEDNKAHRPDERDMMPW